MSLDPQLEHELRYGFKYFNRFMMLMWRLGLGAWINLLPDIGGRIMVIAHKGRKTGIMHHTPVNYAIVNGELYCTAGFGSTSDWYKNVQEDPHIEVWLPEGWWSGVVEDVSDSPDRLPLLRQVLRGSGFVAPMLGIQPMSISNETLNLLSSSYRLLRIHRTQACTGAGGPGDLAWVWPVATVFLLGLLMGRRRR